MLYSFYILYYIIEIEKECVYWCRCAVWKLKNKVIGSRKRAVLVHSLSCDMLKCLSLSLFSTYWETLIFPQCWLYAIYSFSAVAPAKRQNLYIFSLNVETRWQLSCSSWCDDQTRNSRTAQGMWKKCHQKVKQQLSI